MASRPTSKFQTPVTFLFFKILMWFQHCFAWSLKYFNTCIFDLNARMTFSRSSLTTDFDLKKNMEANVYLLQFFLGYSLLFLEYIQKVWRLCFALFLRYDFLKFCFPGSQPEFVHPACFLHISASLFWLKTLLTNAFAVVCLQTVQEFHYFTINHYVDFRKPTK